MAKDIEELGTETAPGEMSLFMDADDETAEAKRAEHLTDLGSTMQLNVNKRVKERFPIEQRMLSDLRQYKGVYESDVAQRLNAKGRYGSNVFVKMTKSKTNFAEAQIMFMGMPNDERNWDIRPTPVPELIEGVNDSTPVADPNNPKQQATDDATGKPITEGDLNSHDLSEARARSQRMRQEIDDQLVEAKYPTHMRGVIHNAALYGTGILKGPQVINRHRRAWVETQDGHISSVKVDRRPYVESVSPWHFFPDMSTNDPTELEDVFERHMMTKSQLRKLAKQPGFMVSQIRKVLEDTDPGPDENDTALSSQLQSISEITNMLDDNRYRVWEYHGPLEKADLEAAKIKVDMDDEMQDYHGVVWFCNGIIIKIAINLFDSNALPYYVLNWEQDEASVFGYGVPYALRDPQRIANAAWRMVLDNAGLSTGPQVFLRRNAITPADGVWQLTPRKVWYVTDDSAKVQDVVKTFNVEGHFAEIFNIYDKALEMAEQDSNLPKVAQGEHSQARETFSGLALRTNIANLPQRRIIKNMDDHVTKPFITNMYDYNMQFNDKSAIKGDYEVHALGSDVLITREIQAQILLQMLQFASDPIYGPWIKPADLLKQAFKANHVAPGEILKTQEEYDRDIEKAKAEQEPPQPSPDAQLKAQTELQKVEMQENTKLQVAIGKNEAKIFELEMQLKAAQEKEGAAAQRETAKLNLELTKLRQERERFIAELRRKDQYGTGI